MGYDDLTFVLYLQALFLPSSKLHHADVETELSFSVRKDRYIRFNTFLLL